MENKIKTSIMVDRELWEEFKSRVGSERGLKALSRVIEEAIEEEICERLVIKALEEIMEPKGELPLMISPVKPRVETNSGKVVKELRESRT